MKTRKFEISRVQTKEDLNAVGAFRYQCYLEEGLIDRNPVEIFLDEYDFADNAEIAIVRMKGRIVGTMRLHILDLQSHKSATMTAFADILIPKIETGARLIDGARFAVAPDLGALRLGIARQTLRQYENFAQLHDVDYGVAAVPESRIEFYERLYGFRKLSEPRSYGNLTKKLVLLGVDLRQRWATGARADAPSKAVKLQENAASTQTKDKP